MSIIDFQSHMNKKLYMTDEYLVYIRSIAMGASDEALRFIVENVTHYELLEAAGSEQARRKAL